MTYIPTTGRFDRSYFDSGLQLGLSSYKDYLAKGYLSEFVEPKVAALVKATGLRAGDKVLDFGCAAGYFVYCLVQDYGIDAYGMDVSVDAIANAPDGIRSRLFLRQDHDLTELPDKAYKVIFAKDVLEHIPPTDLDHVIRELLRVAKKVFVSVPLATKDGGSFIDPIDGQDPTHVNRLTAESWKRKLGIADKTITQLPEVCAALKGAERCKANLALLVNA